MASTPYTSKSVKKQSVSGVAATGYVNNKVQWFFEEVLLPRMKDDLDELAQEMAEEMERRGQYPHDVDWDVVAKGLQRFLVNNTSTLTNEVEGALQMLMDD